jgi:hypothetical protein
MCETRVDLPLRPKIHEYRLVTQASHTQPQPCQDGITSRESTQRTGVRLVVACGCQRSVWGCAEVNQSDLGSSSDSVSPIDNATGTDRACASATNHTMQRDQTCHAPHNAIMVCHGERDLLVRPAVNIIHLDFPGSFRRWSGGSIFGTRLGVGPWRVEMRHSCIPGSENRSAKRSAPTKDRWLPTEI